MAGADRECLRGLLRRYYDGEMQIRRHPGEGVVRDPLDIRRAGNFVFVGYALRNFGALTW